MEKQKNILDYDTVALDEAQDAVIIIDQTLLPGKIELIALHTAQEMWDAISRFHQVKAKFSDFSAYFHIFRPNLQ